MDGATAPRVVRTDGRGRQAKQDGEADREQKDSNRDAGQRQGDRGNTKTIEPVGALEVVKRGDTDLSKETSRGLRKDELVGERCQVHGADQGATAVSGGGA